MRLTCPYCGAKAMRTNGTTIYPHRIDLAAKVFYWCPPCDAYVGAHEATGEPLGTLANNTLRRLRNAAHAAFDPVWRDRAVVDCFAGSNQRLKKPKPLQYFIPQRRLEVYAALAKALDIPVEDCHIGQFDNTMCRRVIDICNSGEIRRFLA